MRDALKGLGLGVLFWTATFGFAYLLVHTKPSDVGVDLAPSEPDPVVGETWQHVEDARTAQNPFETYFPKLAKVLEIRDGWIRYEFNTRSGAMVVNSTQIDVFKRLYHRNVTDDCPKGGK